MQWARPMCKVQFIPGVVYPGHIQAGLWLHKPVGISRTQQHVGLGNVGHIHALISLFECIVMQVNILYVSVPVLLGFILD